MLNFARTSRNPIDFYPNKPPTLTVYAPPAWNNPNATQVDFMQYSIPYTDRLPVGTIMQFPTGAQPSDYSLLVDGQSTTDNQWLPESFTATSHTVLINNWVLDCIYYNNTWIACTSTGKIFTADANLTAWTQRYSGSNALLRIFVDKRNGVIAVAGDNNTFLTSSDNGVNWVVRSIKAGCNIVSISVDYFYNVVTALCTDSTYLYTMHASTFLDSWVQNLTLLKTSYIFDYRSALDGVHFLSRTQLCSIWGGGFFNFPTNDPSNMIISNGYYKKIIHASTVYLENNDDGKVISVGVIQDTNPAARDASFVFFRNTPYIVRYSYSGLLSLYNNSRIKVDSVYGGGSAAIASDERKILIFDAYGSYKKLLPSNNCVKTVPYYAKIGYSWYIKTFI